MNGRVTNFIDKRLSKKSCDYAGVILILAVSTRAARTPAAALHWFTNDGLQTPVPHALVS